MTAGVTAGVTGVPPSALDRLPTPCLVVDAAAAGRNIRRCADFFAAQRAALRPHFKAHKCTTLMRQQLAAGSCVGVTCQTSWEALVLARAGFPDILIANQVVDAAALDELAEAAAIARLTVAVDDDAQVGLLAAAASRHGVPVGVLIELDVGAGRCGLPLGDPSLVPLAEQIARQDRLSFRGLQAYEGHAVLRDSRSLPPGRTASPSATRCCSSRPTSTRLSTSTTGSSPGTAPRSPSGRSMAAGAIV